LQCGALLARIIWHDLNRLSVRRESSQWEYQMSYAKRLTSLATLACLAALGGTGAKAQEVKTVFVIAMENHNWTQPANQFTGGIQQIYLNPNAPFINSLVNGTAVAVVNGSEVNISQQVAFATAYHNVLSTPSGNNPDIHPSEPNYLWAEAGTNFGVLNDNDPFSSTGSTNQNTNLHLSNLLTQAGKTWKSYQEDIDLTPNASNQLTNVVLPLFDWFVPINSFSGIFAPGTTNQFNGSNQYNYAAKHNPQVFFTDTNGGNNATPFYQPQSQRPDQHQPHRMASFESRPAGLSVQPTGAASARYQSIAEPCLRRHLRIAPHSKLQRQSAIV
jgi:hypothetical protein